MAEKPCTTCGTTKPLTDFPRRNAESKDRRQSRCLACTREAVARIRLSPRHRDYDKRQSAAYREAQRKLRLAHTDEFEGYYQEAKRLRGLAS